MQIRCAARCQFMPTRLTNIKELVNIKSRQGCGVMGTKIFCWWDWRVLQLPWKTILITQCWQDDTRTFGWFVKYYNISSRGFDFSMMHVREKCHDPLLICKRSFFQVSITFRNTETIYYNIIIKSVNWDKQPNIGFFGGYFHMVVIFTGCGNNF